MKYSLAILLCFLCACGSNNSETKPKEKTITETVSEGNYSDSWDRTRKHGFRLEQNGFEILTAAEDISFCVVDGVPAGFYEATNEPIPPEVTALLSAMEETNIVLFRSEENRLYCSALKIGLSFCALNDGDLVSIEIRVFPNVGDQSQARIVRTKKQCLKLGEQKTK